MFQISVFADRIFATSHVGQKTQKRP